MIFSRNIIGAEFEGKQLRLAVMENRPALREHWRLREVATIDDYATLPAAKLAEAVASFLGRNRATHAPLVIALPRSEAIVRRLELPLEAESTLAKAVSYQIDSLHPFDPDEVYWDFAVQAKDLQRRQMRVIVFIAHRRAVEEPAQRLRAAGLKPVAVIPSTAALSSLVATFGTAQARNCAVVLSWHRAQVEILAIEEGQLVLSREAAWTGTEPRPEWLEAEVAAVRSQMQAREEPPVVLTCGEAPSWVGQEGTLPVSGLATFLDWNLRQPEDEDWSRHAGVIAVAYAGLKRRGAARINLLPANLRVIEQRWVRVPSYALAVIVLLLGATLGGKNWIGDALYARALRREIAKLEPAVDKVRRMDQQSRALADRIEAMDGLRHETRMKLHVLAELTRIFPPDAWIQTAQINEDTVEITGFAGAASSLLPLLEDSPYLDKVEFLSAITRGADGKELFRIRARITGAKPLGQEATQP